MVDRVSSDEIDERAESFGIVQVLATGLIALTAVDTVMILINRSHVPMGFKGFFLLYGNWLFLPAAAWVAWSSRGLRHRRYLALAGSLATAYLVMTQFRGAWIWHGTFDKFDSSRSAWVMATMLGVVVGIGASYLGPRRPLRDGWTWVTLLGLGIGAVLTLFLSKLWPDPTDFAPTRAIALGLALIVLVVTAILADKLT